MKHTAAVVSVADSLCVGLPREIVSGAGIQVGDQVTLTTHHDVPGRVVMVVELTITARLTTAPVETV